MSEIIKANPLFKNKAVENGSQAAPVQNTWYTAVDLKGWHQLISLMISVATANEDLEWRLTSNGVTLDAIGATCVAGTSYMGYLYPATAGELNCRIQSLTALDQPYLWQDLDLKIEFRKTTNTGAGTISWRIKYKALR